jgi:hypothetical protein
MPDPNPFPPRAAGAVLEAAMKAAMDAAGEALRARRARSDSEPWRKRRPDGSCTARLSVEQAALMAALPLLREVSLSADMPRIIATGMAQEAIVRLRKIHGRHAVDFG